MFNVRLFNKLTFFLFIVLSITHANNTNYQLISPYSINYAGYITASSPFQLPSVSGINGSWKVQFALNGTLYKNDRSGQ